MDDPNFLTSSSQQQNSFSQQPCHPRKHPLHQSIDLLQRNASVVSVVSLDTTVESVLLHQQLQPLPSSTVRSEMEMMSTVLPKTFPPPPPVLQAEDYGSNIDWGSVLYVVFDLETTGRSRQRDEIIELAAVILDENGIEIEDASFSQFVKPRNPIPPFITELTSITNDDVRLAESFPAVGDAFIRFMQQHADEFHDDVPIDHIILVGHNAKVFDVPFLLHHMCEHGIATHFFQDGRFGLGIDTLNLARKAIRDDKSGIGIPSAYNLPTGIIWKLGTSDCLFLDNNFHWMRHRF